METRKNLKTFAPFRETVPELSARETLEGLFSPAMSGGRWWRENFGSRESSSPPPFPEHVLPKRCLVNKSFQIPHCQEHYDCGRTLKGTMKSKSKLLTTDMGTSSLRSHCGLGHTTHLLPRVVVPNATLFRTPICSFTKLSFLICRPTEL